MTQELVYGIQWCPQGIGYQSYVTDWHDQLLNPYTLETAKARAKTLSRRTGASITYAVAALKPKHRDGTPREIDVVGHVSFHDGRIDTREGRMT